MLTVSKFMAGTVDVVRKYCRNIETEDQARMYQFIHDLTACRIGMTETVDVFYQEMNYVILLIFWLLIDMD